MRQIFIEHTYDLSIELFLVFHLKNLNEFKGLFGTSLKLDVFHNLWLIPARIITYKSTTHIVCIWCTTTKKMLPLSLSKQSNKKLEQRRTRINKLLIKDNLLYQYNNSKKIALTIKINVHNIINDHTLSNTYLLSTIQFITTITRAAMNIHPIKPYTM